MTSLLRHVSPDKAHSSNAMVMSEPSRCWISIERAVSAQRRTIQMALKRHAIRVHLSPTSQRENLVAAAIGQDRLVPVHELMQPTQLSDAFSRRPQQRWYVFPNRISAPVAATLRLHRFDRAGRPHRHEGRFDCAVRKGESAAPRGRLGP